MATKNTRRSHQCHHGIITHDAILNQNNVCEETQEILDDDDDEEEEDDVQEEKLRFAESLAMLDKLNKCCFFFLDDESHKMLSTVTRKLENIQQPPLDKTYLGVVRGLI